MSLSILELECRTANDKFSMASALFNAADYSGLDEASPVYRFAIQRFQLAILRRALRGPETMGEWKAIWKTGCFDNKAITDYLKKWIGRFDLFDSKTPFLQSAALRGEDEKPSAYLASTLSADTNIAHFAHA